MVPRLMNRTASQAVLNPCSERPRNRAPRPAHAKGASVIKPLVFRGRMRVSPVAAFTLRLIVDIYGRYDSGKGPR